jgi:hypothetical protein
MPKLRVLSRSKRSLQMLRRPPAISFLAVSLALLVFVA